MKVAINCNFLAPKSGGIKEYILNILDGFYELKRVDIEFVVYVLEDNLDYAKSVLGNRFRIKTTPFTSKQKIKRSLFEQSFWRKEEERERFDIFHSPFFYSPKFRAAKIVITVHDMRFERYPSTYTKLRYFFLKRVVKRSLIRCDYIITISQFTKDEIIELYGIDESKISVVWEAIDKSKFNIKNLDLQSLDQKYSDFCDDFLLSVGHLEPRKNYNRLIKAFANLRDERGYKGRLVIVGKKAHDFQETLQLINEEDVIYLNFVSDDELIYLYYRSRLFLFPSIYEGFGFPPLEAAALDTASVVSNTSCIPEICGGGAVYFDPFNVDDIASKISTVINNPVLEDELKSAMKRNLERFSWERNVTETLNIYEKVIV